jgi:hypothetical protein
LATSLLLLHAKASAGIMRCHPFGGELARQFLWFPGYGKNSPGSAGKFLV